MGFFSWRSTVSGKDIMNIYGNDHKGIAIMLPDNTIIQGDYGGYGDIHVDGGETVDIYDKIAEIMFGESNRDLIFNTKKTFSKDGKDITIQLFDWEQPIEKSNILEGDGSDIIGKKMNELTQEGFERMTDFNRAQKLIKVVLESEVDQLKGKTYDDLHTSEDAEGQGHWKSSYGRGKLSNLHTPRTEKFKK
jgi:hypothetical protein